jgi:hypothetical protein
MNGNCICERLTDRQRNGEETKSPLRLAGWGLKIRCCWHFQSSYRGSHDYNLDRNEFQYMYMNEKFSTKLPDKAANPPHPSPQHSSKTRARKVNRRMKSDTRLVREVSPESSSSEEDDRSHTSSMKTSSIIREERYSKTFGAKLPPFTGTELWKLWYNRFESVANLNHET